MDAPVSKRDHGGGLDAAMARYGGTRDQWLDLSTGINPVPYPVGNIPAEAWTRLPDAGAMDRLLQAARTFWNVPDTAQIIAAPGVSSLIARLPTMVPPGAYIPGPTYNEHAAAFAAHGTLGDPTDPSNPTHIHVHPNNPDGRFAVINWAKSAPLTVIDESFAETCMTETLIDHTARPGVIVYKGLGKFWGLGGLRLGFAIGQLETVAPFAELLGPWPVSGPALEVGARALEDHAWADATRARLTADTARLDALVTAQGATLVGGTTLFRTYAVRNAAALQTQLAASHIWTRIFPYSDGWIRFGLPGTEAHWAQLQAAL